MSEGTIELVQPHRGTVVYARKRNLGNYESEDASISVQFDIDPADEVGTSGRAEAAFNQAKALVFDQLGIAANVAIPNGAPENSVAAVQAAFPGSVVTSPSDEVNAITAPTKATGGKVEGYGGAPSAPTRSASDAASTPSSSPAEAGPSCPNCGGPMYDNRATKKNPRQPDFRCKGYRNDPPCDGVIWPPRSN